MKSNGSLANCIRAAAIVAALVAAAPSPAADPDPRARAQRHVHDIEELAADYVGKLRIGAGGAGVTATMPGRNEKGMATPAARMSEKDRDRYRGGKTPAETHAAYVAWMAHSVFDPDVELFTPASRRYLAGLPLSPAYRHFILFGEYGKSYKVIERGDLAVLIFTRTPFTSPHFYVREDGVWRMDVVAEVRNTRERVGGAFTWDYRGRVDDYTRAFSDLFVDFGDVRRFKDGDNRRLAVTLGQGKPL